MKTKCHFYTPDGSLNLFQEIPEFVAVNISRGHTPHLFIEGKKYHTTVVYYNVTLERYEIPVILSSRG